MPTTITTTYVANDSQPRKNNRSDKVKVKDDGDNNNHSKHNDGVDNEMRREGGNRSGS